VVEDDDRRADADDVCDVMVLRRLREGGDSKERGPEERQETHRFTSARSE
jgi:hypothetical protein